MNIYGKEQETLAQAIRAFTVEAPDDQPNGPAEKALLDLEAALAGYPWRNPAIDAARDAAARLCEALADDTKRLREAAEAYFGGDFTKPAHTWSDR